MLLETELFEVAGAKQVKGQDEGHDEYLMKIHAFGFNAPSLPPSPPPPPFLLYLNARLAERKGNNEKKKKGSERKCKKFEDYEDEFDIRCLHFFSLFIHLF